MAIILIMGKDGVIKQNVNNNSTLVVQAKAGETYKIVDSETGTTPKNLIAKRTANTLSLFDEESRTTVELEGFWSNCSTGETQCFAVVDVLSETGSLLGQSTITQVPESLSALTAGVTGTLLPDATVTATTGWLAATGVTPSAVGYTLGAGVVGAVIHKEELGKALASVIILPPEPLEVHITGVVTDATGKVVVNGITSPNIPVTVTIPGNTPITVVSDANGNFVTPMSPLAPPSGVIGAVAIKLETAETAKDSKPYLDITPPVVVILEPVLSDAAGNAVVYGKTEPNLPVTIKFPDGSTVTTIADAVGVFGPVVSPVPQHSGAISATAVDPAGNSGSDTAPFVDVTAPVITITEPVASDGTGHAVVYGKTEPNLPVTITFLDGTTASTTADAMGAFGPVTSAAPQASGPITAATEDAAHNKATDTAPFVDVTAPVITITEPVASDATGHAVVYGKTEPNLPVTITFLDGTTASTTADAMGAFGPVTSAAPQASGPITAATEDAAHNKATDTAPFVDVTAPVITITEPVASDATGHAVVYGKTEPNLPVTITFLDGTTASTTADAMGAFGPVTSAAPQASGPITAATEDAAHNKATDTAPFVDVTAPVITITEPVASDATGHAVVYGKTEPNLPVTITFLDGTTASTTADAMGAFGPVTSAAPQASGPITAATEDAAHNKATDTAPFVDVTAPVITITEPVASDATGHAVVYGKTEPNLPVTITFLDGTTASTTADAMGAFGPVTSAAPQASGPITAATEDAAHNKATDTAPFVDVTAPVITITEPVASDATGHAVVYGKTEPNLPVTITFLDGTTASTTADAMGAFGPVTSAAPQASGPISAATEDAAHNKATDTAPFVDVTAPVITITEPVASDATGHAVVYGKTEPNLPVTITFLDGTTASTTADAMGAFGPVTSAAPQASGPISAATEDAAHNKATDTAPFVDVTAPVITITEPVASDATGHAVVYGKTEPNLPVTITFLDGTTASTTADAMGAFGPVTSAAPQASGPITAATEDAAHNKASDTAPFVDTTPPTVDITAVTFTPELLTVIAGVSEPNATVTINFPDGSTATTTADPITGKFSVTSPNIIGVLPSEVVTAVASDAAHNNSIPDTDTIRRLSPTDLSKISEQWNVGAWYDDITTVPGDPSKLASGNNLLIFDVPTSSQPLATDVTFNVYVRKAPTGETEESLNTHTADKQLVTSAYNAATGEFTITDPNVFSPTAANGNITADGYYYISYEYLNAAGSIVAQSGEYRMGVDPWQKYPITPSPVQPNYLNGQADIITITKVDADLYGDHVSSATPLIDKEYLLNIEPADTVYLVNDANGVWTQQGMVIIPTVNALGALISTQTYIRYDNSGSTTDVLVDQIYQNHVTII